MSRFISYQDRLVLYRNNGTPAVKFDYGVYNGDITVIESTADNDLNIMMYKPTWAGAETAFDTITEANAKQRAGLGDLADADRRSTQYTWFEAPLLVAGDDDVAAVEGTYYIVNSGRVEYDGKVYRKGETFYVADDTVTATAAPAGYEGSKFSLYFSPALLNKPNQYYAENFKIKFLEQGDEYLSYYHQDGADNGFTPQADGWVRPQ